MKYIKAYKIFEDVKDNTELVKQLDKYHIKNYTINNDGTIDVDGDVSLSYRKFTSIPFKFGKVTGHFDCSTNQLISLVGSPKEVGGDYHCSINKIENLIGGPEDVGGGYYCQNSNLVSLEGCAGDIGGYLYCVNNCLDMLDCSSVINGSIYCTGNGFKEEPEFFGICNKIYWK